MAENPTLAQAVARIDEARAQLGVNDAARLPRVAINAAAGRAKALDTTGASDATGNGVLIANSASVGTSVTVAMIAGMLPIALGFGADASFRQPMATAVIGGLITSTALSLLVVPVVFGYVDGFETGLSRWFKQLRVTRPDGQSSVGV